jgi:predicted dehydrogenase
MSKTTKTNYALVAEPASKAMAAPELPYRPPKPRRYRPRIGLIGCGGIATSHLTAYRDAGWQVVGLCDVALDRAEKRRAEFFPAARAFADYQELLRDESIDVADIALHPTDRGPVIRAALKAGKHVLSQKPFTLDLTEGRQLISLAKRQGVKLAVNQNGRWAPYASYMRCAVAAGLIGEVQSVNLHLNWDHTWCQGTPFEQVHHLILYDFGIHWFDLCAQFFAGRKPKRVFAEVANAPDQQMRPPMVGLAMVAYPNGLASLVFDGHSRFAPEEFLQVSGTEGLLRARGPLVHIDTVELHTRKGSATAKVEGKWFHDGFRGAMGELLCAIEEKREPQNSAANNLPSLELCFAALRAADTGIAQIPGKVLSVDSSPAGREKIARRFIAG